MNTRSGEAPHWTHSDWPANIPKIGSKHSDNRSQESRVLREMFAQTAVLLAIIAVWVYILMSLAYDAFYRSLGVEPADVGLSYSSVLARSSGFGVWVLILAVVSIPLSLGYGILLGVLARKVLGRLVFPEAAVVGWLSRWLPMIVPTLIVLLIAVTPGYTQIRDANRAASAAQHGYAVRPFGNRFTTLSVHADPVVIQPASDPKTATSIASFQCNATRTRSPCTDEFLYLGQANGTVVVYNVTKQRSIYLPASSVVLHISNCQTRLSVDAACSRRYRPW